MDFAKLRSLVELSKRIVVFAPHPDDETFGCGGTIAKRLSEGYDVLIVIMTDGRYAFRDVLGIEFDPTPEELKNIRKDEVRRAARILGMREENLIFLDFVDGTLTENEEKAEDKVVEILSKYNPDEVYIPYKRDGHVDHRATYRIVSGAIKKLGKKITKYQYQITHKYARIGPLFEMFFNSFKGCRKYVDISKFLSAKECAIKEFRSEIMAVSSKRHKTVIGNVKKFLKNDEIFYVE